MTSSRRLKERRARVSHHRRAATGPPLAAHAVPRDQATRPSPATTPLGRGAGSAPLSRTPSDPLDRFEGTDAGCLGHRILAGSHPFASEAEPVRIEAVVG